MPAESHCSIVGPEPRPQRSEQLLQTNNHTHTYRRKHAYTHKTSAKKEKIKENRW